LLNDASRGKNNNRYNYRESSYSSIVALIKAYISKKEYILVNSKLIFYKKYYYLFYTNLIY
jgi:hypothetical protein